MPKEQLLALLKEHLEIEVEIHTVTNPAGSSCWTAVTTKVFFDGVRVASHQGSVDIEGVTL